jgi:hypothetical protein
MSGDEDLRAAFADYRDSQSSRVRAAEVAVVRRLGVARRRRRHGFLSMAIIVGVLVPAAALALSTGQAPTGFDHPTPQRTVALPPGGLTRAQLMVSSVEMPVFEGDATGTCPHGEVGFADDRLNLYTSPDTSDYLRYADIDRDGSFETVLHVRCLVAGKVVAEQVLVVAPGRGASVELKGRVIGTGGEISAIDKVGVSRDPAATGAQAEVDSAIFLQLSGPRNCCATFYTAVEHQRRSYVWDGQDFKQRTGLTAFSRPPADLVIAAQELNFEAGVGSFLVTITNAGTVAVDSMMLKLVARGMRATDPEWWPTVPGVDPATIETSRPLVGLEPGDSRTVEVHVRLLSSDSRSGSLSVTVVGILGMDAINDEAADANPGDNEKVEVALRFG